MPPKGVSNRPKQSIVDLKHNRVMKLLLKGVPAYKAYARIYGCSEEMAHKNCYRIFKTANEGIKQALRDAGVTERKVAKIHSDAMEASREITVGEETVKIPDWQARLKALEMFHKIEGSFSPEKQEIEHKGDINIHAELLDELEKK